MSGAPIKLTLYNPETNEVERELTRAFIPTGIFTELAEMMQNMDLAHPERLSKEAVESLYALVAELFGQQITIDQIKSGTDLGEFAALLQTLMTRVSAVMPEMTSPNPRPPEAGQRRRRR